MKKKRKYMRLSEFAEQMGISLRTAQRYYKKGIITNSIQVNTGTIFVDRENPFRKSEGRKKNDDV